MKRILALLILCGTALFAVAQTELSIPYELHRLDNGLTVILHEDHTTPMVAVNVWYHVGSGNEKPGRTGFAHLFEHLMFEGSKNVPEGKFDQWLEAGGGSNNGSTNTDRTNYYEVFPKSSLELALFLESDRMGYLADVVTNDTVDGQRDVVKNERRFRVDNAPYGKAEEALSAALFPEGHPYSWSVIGSMEDLSAADEKDVIDFFNTYYVPNNASIVIAGDIKPEETLALVKKWFDEIPAGKPVPAITAPAASLHEEKVMVMEDRVSLPKLFLAWHAPAVLSPGEAELDLLSGILSRGKNSRLYKKLVYELQIAQSVRAYLDSGKLGSVFRIEAVAKPGHTLEEIKTVIDEEIRTLQTELVDKREMDRFLHQEHRRTLEMMERLSGFRSKSDILNYYYFYAGNPDYLKEDLLRYHLVDQTDLRQAARRYLDLNRRIVLSVVPQGAGQLAVGQAAQAGGNP